VDKISLTKYIEVLQCNNHISSYLADVVRITRTRTGRNSFNEGLPTEAKVYPVKGSKDITCRECPKGARFLVRSKNV